jgi:hypothetical protein
VTLEQNTQIDKTVTEPGEFLRAQQPEVMLWLVAAELSGEIIARHS